MVYLIIVAVSLLLFGMCLGAGLGAMATEAANRSTVARLYRMLATAENERDAAVSRARMLRVEQTQITRGGVS